MRTWTRCARTYNSNSLLFNSIISPKIKNSSSKRVAVKAVVLYKTRPLLALNVSGPQPVCYCLCRPQYCNNQQLEPFIISPGRGWWYLKSSGSDVPLGKWKVNFPFSKFWPEIGHKYLRRFLEMLVHFTLTLPEELWVNFPEISQEPPHPHYPLLSGHSISGVTSHDIRYL